LAAGALAVAIFIYWKSIKKSSKPLNKNNPEYQEDYMDTL
jgi:hypothetical protein